MEILFSSPTPLFIVIADLQKLTVTALSALFPQPLTACTFTTPEKVTLFTLTGKFAIMLVVPCPEAIDHVAGTAHTYELALTIAGVD